MDYFKYERGEKESFFNCYIYITREATSTASLLFRVFWSLQSWTRRGIPGTETDTIYIMIITSVITYWCMCSVSFVLLSSCQSYMYCHGAGVCHPVVQVFKVILRSLSVHFWFFWFSITLYLDNSRLQSETNQNLGLGVKYLVYTTYFWLLLYKVLKDILRSFSAFRLFPIFNNVIPQNCCWS